MGGAPGSGVAGGMAGSPGVHPGGTGTVRAMGQETERVASGIRRRRRHGRFTEHESRWKRKWPGKWLARAVPLARRPPVRAALPELRSFRQSAAMQPNGQPAVRLPRPESLVPTAISTAGPTTEIPPPPVRPDPSSSVAMAPATPLRPGEWRPSEEPPKRDRDAGREGKGGEEEASLRQGQNRSRPE